MRQCQADATLKTAPESATSVRATLARAEDFTFIGTSAERGDLAMRFMPPSAVVVQRTDWHSWSEAIWSSR